MATTKRLVESGQINKSDKLVCFLTDQSAISGNHKVVVTPTVPYQLFAAARLQFPRPCLGYTGAAAYHASRHAK